MAQIILDFGSGNSHKNDLSYAKRMLDELKAVDTGKHEIIIKHQLFKEAGDNIPLKKEIFHELYYYAAELGYKTTSSVFDEESLEFLLKYDIPFVKIACRPTLYPIIGKVPRDIPVYVSLGSSDASLIDYKENTKPLLCVSNYPAKMEDYEGVLRNGLFGFKGISDHTTNFGLWYRYQPDIIEWHYVLEHDTNNLDGGLFARTPSQLSEVL